MGNVDSQPQSVDEQFINNTLSNIKNEYCQLNDNSVAKILSYYDQLYKHLNLSLVKSQLPNLINYVSINDNMLDKSLKLMGQSLKMKKDEFIVNILLDHYYYDTFGARNARFINIVVMTSMSNVYTLNCKYIIDYNTLYNLNNEKNA